MSHLRLFSATDAKALGAVALSCAATPTNALAIPTNTEAMRRAQPAAVAASYALFVAIPACSSMRMKIHPYANGAPVVRR